MDLSAFEQSTHSIRTALLLIDMDGKVLASNPAARIALGHTLSVQLLQQEGELQTKLLHFLRNASQSTSPIPGTIRIQEKLWRCHASLAWPPLQDNQKALLLQLDNLKLANQSFKDLNEKITELRQELHNLRILEDERLTLFEREVLARKNAESLSRQKDEFLASLSHELRTPLNAITGWVSILQDSPDKAAVLPQALAVIKRNVKNQNTLIEDMVDLSRAVIGQLKIECKPTDLSALIHDAASALHPVLETREIELKISIELENTVADVDPKRMRQVIWNLLSNACNYTQQKGGQIQLVLCQVETHIEIRVEDNGDGIEPELLPHIFDRFRQGDGSSTRQAGGMGLGLAIVHHIVELHGGIVMVESQGTGHGSCFTVSLPQSRKLPTAAIQQNAGPLSKQADAAKSLQGLHLLLIDDHTDTREVLSKILSFHGARVVAAESAEQARSEYNVAAPDAIISDLEMPNEDGFTFIRKLRLHEKNKKLTPVPALAITAHCLSNAEERAHASGFDGFATKPIKPHSLISLIAGLVDAQPMRPGRKDAI